MSDQTSAATGTDGDRPEIESIWLTTPSIKPLLLAIAVLLVLVGLFAFRPLMYAALLAVAWLKISWLNDARRESDELPLS